MSLILTNRFHIADADQLRVFRLAEGYASLEVLFQLRPSDVIEEIHRAGLTGRGPTGMLTAEKWESFVHTATHDSVLQVLPVSSEPGACKDRVLIEKDPHQILEGVIACAFALGIHQAHIFLPPNWMTAHHRLQGAVKEAENAGFLGTNILKKGFDLGVHVHRVAASSFFCPESKTKKTPPVLKHNIETVCTLPFIILNGAGNFRRWGSNSASGTRLFSVSGHIMRPGVYERPLGYRLSDLIEKDCGGVTGRGHLKAVFPGGIMQGVLTSEEAKNLTLDATALTKNQSGLGAGNVIVLNDTVDMLWVLANIIKTYRATSCEFCTPCREGLLWSEQILTRLCQIGKIKDDLDLLTDVVANMSWTSACHLPKHLSCVVESMIKKFPGDFF